MTKTLYWLQCGGCGGDSMALLNTESPNLIELLGLLDIEFRDQVPDGVEILLAGAD